VRLGRWRPVYQIRHSSRHDGAVRTGHSAYGRYAQGRGANPADVFGLHFNEAGDLAFAGMKVRVEKAGRQQVLSRLESRIGVYGEGLGEEGH
jgi:hypothetical protein